MPRAKWVVAALTVTLLCTGIGVLQSTEGAHPSASTATTDDSLPSRALGLSGHRRLVRQLERPDEHAPGKGARSPRTAPGPLRAVTGPLRPARPLRLRIPSLHVDVPLAEGEGAAPGPSWDAGGPPPGSAGTAVVTGAGLRLGELRPGRTVEIPRADGRTAVFTVVRVSPGEASGDEGPAGRPQLRLTGGETAVLARLTGQRRTR
ncbi:class F sortase [Streptomyces sp. NPDC091371]|uniref:class F sortase n=1 Tax=Streptomyces sp. NPDC091371 TaxID=3155303 RepID=UPI003438403A